MSVKISVIVKEPGKKPRHVCISDTLENLQRTVGGYIEVVTLSKDACVICNEEGRNNGLPYCCDILDLDFYGTVILAGRKGDDITDFPLSFKQTKDLFPKLWEVA